MSQERCGCAIGCTTGAIQIEQETPLLTRRISCFRSFSMFSICALQTLVTSQLRPGAETQGSRFWCSTAYVPCNGQNVTQHYSCKPLGAGQSAMQQSGLHIALERHHPPRHACRLTPLSPERSSIRQKPSKDFMNPGFRSRKAMTLALSSYSKPSGWNR